jgi:integrase
LQVDAVLGCRRGELLALRWGDIVDGRAVITLSLCQTKKGGLFYKTTKGKKNRTLKLMDPAPAVLAHKTPGSESPNAGATKKPYPTRLVRL